MDMKSFGLQTVSVPSSGIGSWQSKPGEVEQAVEWAIDAGVRLIDTAYMYYNENEIGKAINKAISGGKVKREDLFVVTKLPMMAMHAEDVEEYFNSSLKSLGLDYLDLYLIHGPVGAQKDEKTRNMKIFEGNMVMLDKKTDLIAIWQAFEKLMDQGKVRSIGVSNFSSKQLKKISKVARYPIAVNQVECSIYFQQKKLRATMQQLGIRVMAYGPLGSPGRANVTLSPLQDAVVQEIATSHNKTPAQVLLRYLVELGMIVIPKSIKKHRIKENFDIYDFELTKMEMVKLNSLDKGSFKGRTSTFGGMGLKTDVPIESLPEYSLDCPEDQY